MLRHTTQGGASCLAELVHVKLQQKGLDGVGFMVERSNLCGFTDQLPTGWGHLRLTGGIPEDQGSKEYVDDKQKESLPTCQHSADPLNRINSILWFCG